MTRGVRVTRLTVSFGAPLVPQRPRSPSWLQRDPRALAHKNDLLVFADVDDDTLEIVVADSGRGLHSLPRTPGLGAGLNIIAECADEFAIRERLPEGVEVW